MGHALFRSSTRKRNVNRAVRGVFAALLPLGMVGIIGAVSAESAGASGNQSLTITPTAAAFHTVMLGGEAEVTFRVNVHGTTTVYFPVSGSVATITNNPTGAYAVTATTCRGTVPQGQGCTVVVVFRPTTHLGSIPGTVQVTAQTAETVSATLIGSASSPLTINYSSITFGSVGIGHTSPATTVILTDLAGPSLGLHVTGVTFTGTAAFSTAGSSCTNVTIGGGAFTTTCKVSVQFRPTSATSANGLLILKVTGHTHSVPLSGVGVPDTTATIAPTTLTFPTEPVGAASAAQQITLTNTGVNTLFIGGTTVTLTGNNPTSFTVVNDGCAGFSVAPTGHCTIFVVFNPTSVAVGLSAEISVAANYTGTGLSKLFVNLVGTGTTPGTGLTAVPPILNFGSMATGATSPVMYLKVTNTSTQTVTLGVQTTPLNTNYVIGADSCVTATLSLGASCDVAVTFSPSALGTDDGTLIIPVTGGPTLLVGLFGTGTNGSATLTPASLTFGPEASGQVSGFMPVTITDTGTAPLSTITLSLTGTNFVLESHVCTGLTLGHGESCTTAVAFAPTSVSNSLSGLLIVRDSAGVQTASLSGIGTASAAKITVSPSTLNFESVGKGQTATQTVTVTDTGFGPVLLTPTLTILGTTSFTVTNGCAGVTLDTPSNGAGGTSCSLVVTFKPTTVGSQSAVIQLFQATRLSLTDVTATGTGVADTNATLTPSSVTFLPQPVGSASAAQAVTLTNTGTAPLFVNATTVTLTGADIGSFNIVNNGCAGVTVAPGDHCTVFVVFDPAEVAVGLSAELDIHANFSGTGVSQLSTSLVGNGTTPGATVAVSPSVLNFGAIGETVPAPFKYVTVTNNGPTAISLGTPTSPTNGDYTIGKNGCEGLSLSPRAKCSIAVEFTPTQLGSDDGTLSIPVAGGQTLLVGLYGTGASTTSVTVTPPGTPGLLVFPDTALTTNSLKQFVVVTNTGPNPLIIDTVTFLIGGTGTTAFTLATDNCTGRTVAPGGNCQIGIVFKPAKLGAVTATLGITDNGVSAQQVVHLEGIGSTSSYSVSATAVTFGNVGKGITSPPQTLTVTNTSATDPLTFPADPAILSTTTVGFVIENDACAGKTIQPGATCTIKITFTPNVLGTANALLTVTPTTATASVIDVSGVGVAQVSSVTLSPADHGTLSFPSTLIGSTSPSQSVVVTVQGTNPLTVTSLVIAGTAADAPLFKVVATTCLGNASISDGGSCAIAITFAPASIGVKTAQLQISDNATGTPQVINLTGTGVTALTTPVGITATGYDMVGSDGGVFVFDAPGQTGGFYGSLPGIHVVPNKPVVGMVPTVTDKGYFLVASDGGVFSFGTAPFLGSLPGIDVIPNQPIVGIVAANTDKGYFLVGRDGGVFAFGTVTYLGSVPGLGVALNDVVGIAATPSGDGYWVITSTGTVYGFGKAEALGTVRSTTSPVSAIAGTPTGGGYWVSTRNGKVFAEGSARSYGTLPAIAVTPALPVIGIVHTAGTGGYWLLGSDGGLFAFGDAPFYGSLPGLNVHVNNIVGAVPN